MRGTPPRLTEALRDQAEESMAVQPSLIAEVITSAPGVIQTRWNTSTGSGKGRQF